MLVEAVHHGLLVDGRRAEVVLGKAPPPPSLPRYVEPNPKGVLHPSLRTWWWIAECIPRRRNGRISIPMGRWWRQIPEGSKIHATVPLTGAKVNMPVQHEIEPWVRYEPAPSVTAPEAVPMQAVVQKMAAAADTTQIHPPIRR
jgi:hypothetical protein